ncbi:MAG: response regulator [Asticcacaulis sp.]|nr:response regulator [Asticcacaulis sp.]
MGYQISIAETMEQAFSSVDLEMVDLVVSDIFMPGMGGIEGIQIIKSTWPAVSIIAMSAGVEQKVANTQVLSAARHMGAHALLPKPFAASDVIDLVEAVLIEKPSAA